MRVGGREECDGIWGGSVCARVCVSPREEACKYLKWVYKSVDVGTGLYVHVNVKL